MLPEHSVETAIQAEKEIYQKWDFELTEFFRRLDEAAPSQGAKLQTPEPTPEIRRYRDRVGQDLQAFHEKLSNIMESEKRGQ